MSKLLKLAVIGVMIWQTWAMLRFWVPITTLSFVFYKMMTFGKKKGE